MPQYEHKCRACDLEWLEEYGLNDDPPETCPECQSTDCYRCVTTSGSIHFKGPGWSPDGYYKSKALDKYKSTGIKVYDRKEDMEREAAGAERERTLRRLKHENEVAKKTFGPDAAVTQAEAERRIDKAVKKRLKQ